MRPTMTHLQTMMLVRLHLASNAHDEELLWTSDEWPELRRLREAGLIEQHHDTVSTTPEGAKVAQRALDAIAAWDAVRKHLLQVYPRPNGCTIMPTGETRPAPDWLIYGRPSEQTGPVGGGQDPIAAVLQAAAVLEGGND